MFLNRAVHLHMLWDSSISFFINGEKNDVCCDIWSYVDRLLRWPVLIVRQLLLEWIASVLFIDTHAQQRYSYSVTNTRTLFRVSRLFAHTTQCMWLLIPFSLYSRHRLCDSKHSYELCAPVPSVKGKLFFSVYFIRLFTFWFV